MSSKTINQNIKKILLIDEFNNHIYVNNNLDETLLNYNIVCCYIFSNEETIGILFGRVVKIDNVLRNLNLYNIGYYFSKESISLNDYVLCNVKNDRLTLYVKVSETDMVISNYSDFVKEINNQVYKNERIKKLSIKVS